MPKTQKPGPKPDHLKVEDDWEEAVKKALKKKRPKGGWPEKPTDKGFEPDPNPKSEK